MTAARRRGVAAALLAATIAAGLVSRTWPLPGLLAEHTGDALYATAVFLVAATAAPGLGTGRLALLAGAFAGLVECSQLLQWHWLVALRSTRPGALLLGQGFQAADLVALAVGVLVGVAADVTFLRRSTRPRAQPDRLPHHSTGPRT